VSILRLVRRNLWRHPIRSVLTFGFAALALFLFVFLRSAVTTLESATKAAAANRIAVQSATSLFVYMPESYWGKIRQVPGVESVSPWVWFGGYYQDPKNFFAQFAVDLATHLEQYPEAVVPAEERQALLADRQGCMVGFELAEKYGWKPGDRIPILSNIYSRPGGLAWEFTLRAVYRSERANIDNKTMFFHWEYLKEMRRALRAEGYVAGEQDVGVYMTKVAQGHDPEQVIASIDALFENGPQRTRTQTEAAFQAQFATMLGSLPTFLGLIGSAVLFAIFFSVLNTAGMAGRERSRDVGILKALGFRDRLAAGMLLVESMLVVGLGGVLGVLLGWASAPYFRDKVAVFMPNYRVEVRTLALGLGIALGIGLLGGLFPAIRLARLRTVNTLRQEA
jgi:putative ABC transport system permease protein